MIPCPPAAAPIDSPGAVAVHGVKYCRYNTTLGGGLNYAYTWELARLLKNIHKKTGAITSTPSGAHTTNGMHRRSGRNREGQSALRARDS